MALKMWKLKYSKQNILILNSFMNVYAYKLARKNNNEI